MEYYEVLDNIKNELEVREQDFKNYSHKEVLICYNVICCIRVPFYERNIKPVIRCSYQNLKDTERKRKLN